ncbi:hypothetical protein L210DRAFT_960475 [Boletus edulis BED1]|uniref:HAT C-terminal dimerisation domain-containing protein n=1 Tax=Boletus edulis BED1 TaxID=1328754 RepID=A0AAD4BJW9_BOLED|nr:hypothetical protein L210DRAFT_960475 [Boletus edulis BED1]
MTEFATRIQQATGQPWNARKQQVRCLAHIINPMQALLFGLVQSICIKEHSSAKSKELLKAIQRWAICQLTDDEWSHVSILLALLGKAEQSQQSFSSDSGPVIHLALPALKSLHKVWHTHSNKTKYIDFWPALEAGVSKITEYYEKTADCDVYIMAILLLDPVQKANHIHRFWGHEMYDDTIKHAEELLLRELSDDDDDDTNTADVSATPSSEPQRPWLIDFHGYLNLRDQLVPNMSIVQWSRYPVWGSLTSDYLSVMATSVSSKCAFSSAGITINKQCN